MPRTIPKRSRITNHYDNRMIQTSKHIKELGHKLEFRLLEIWEDRCFDVPCPNRLLYMELWRAQAKGIEWIPPDQRPEPKPRVHWGNVIFWALHWIRFDRVVEAYSIRTGKACDCPLRKDHINKMSTVEFLIYLLRVAFNS